MAHGQLVFDGPTAEFTADAARDLYGLEAQEAMGEAFEPQQAPAAPEPALAH